METYLIITEFIGFLMCIWGSRLIRVPLKKKGNKYWLIGFIILFCCLSTEQFVGLPSLISIALISLSGAMAFDTIRFVMKLNNKNIAEREKIIEKLKEEISDKDGGTKKNPQYYDYDFARGHF